MLVALFVLLIAGTVDIVARVWSDDLSLCEDRCAPGPVDVLGWSAWYAAANGLILTAAVLAYWLGRALLGWWRARRGDLATVASHGGLGWVLAIVVLAAANVAGGVLLVVDLVHADAARDRAVSALDLVTLASNLWVLAYYAPRRRWDGARV